jgi:hypothetical protein
MLSGFMQGLAELGWTDGRNMHLDVRWEQRRLPLLATGMASIRRMYNPGYPPDLRLLSVRLDSSSMS